MVPEQAMTHLHTYLCKLLHDWEHMLHHLLPGKHSRQRAAALHSDQPHRVLVCTARLAETLGKLCSDC